MCFGVLGCLVNVVLCCVLVYWSSGVFDVYFVFVFFFVVFVCAFGVVGPLACLVLLV